MSNAALNLSTDIVSEFHSAMTAAGILTDEIPIADGLRHRIRTNSDKNGKTSAGYVLYPDNNPAGGFWSFKLGTYETWSLKNYKEFTPQEKAEYAKQMAQAREERKKAQTVVHKEARGEAERLWSDAKPETGTHKYLKDKRVQAYRIRSNGTDLLIPLRDAGGILHSIQTIDTQGKKLFLSGGAIKSNYFSIGKPNGKIVIAEGYSTAASIHESTGLAVAIAFNAGNLTPIAKALREKYPDMEIIIAGDNDQWTEGNPGKIKAAEAAKAVNGKLVIPEFVNTESKPTDFNDLAALEGQEQVKKFIDEAQAIEETYEDTTVSQSKNDEHVIKELVQLSPFQYDRVRNDEAEKLGVQVSTLDKEIKEARKDIQTNGFNLHDPNPYSAPVNGADLLDKIVIILKRYLVLPEHAVETIALWILFTYVIDSVRICTMLAITSPEKRCGKTSTLAVLLKLCSKALPASNISPAALFRTTEKLKPTLLIDEADTFLRNSEEMRGIINSGHTREMAFTIRTVGDNYEPKHFSTWGAKVIATIGKLKDTIMDRCIEICMKRKKPGEKVECLKNFDGLEIRSHCVRWANDNAENIKNHEPEIPISLHDRAADNWEPLLSIAELAGGKWPEVAKKAACALTQNDVEEDSIKIQLLADIQSIFKTENVIDRIWTERLLNQLYNMEERPWADWRKGKALSARNLSRILKTFSIQSKDLKMEGVNKKGYRLEDFSECFVRYLPATPLLDSVDAPFSDYQCATQNQQVAKEKPLKPASDKEGSAVADENRDIGGNEDMPHVQVTL